MEYRTTSTGTRMTIRQSRSVSSNSSWRFMTLYQTSEQDSHNKTHFLHEEHLDCASVLCACVHSPRACTYMWMRVRAGGGSPSRTAPCSRHKPLGAQKKPQNVTVAAAWRAEGASELQCAR